MSLLESYNKFLYMQCHFSKDVCDNVFGNLSDHIYKKWESVDLNIIDFLSRLDDVNKRKLFTWVENKMNK